MFGRQLRVRHQALLRRHRADDRLTAGSVLDAMLEVSIADGDDHDSRRIVRQPDVGGQHVSGMECGAWDRRAARVAALVHCAGGAYDIGVDPVDTGGGLNAVRM